MSKEEVKEYSWKDLNDMFIAYMMHYNPQFLEEHEVQFIELRNGEAVFEMTKLYQNLNMPLSQLEKFKFVLNDRGPVFYDKLMTKMEILSKMDQVIIDLEMYLSENRSGTRGHAIGSVLTKYKKGREFFESIHC